MNLERLKSVDNDSLKCSCHNLEDLLKYDMVFDINGVELFLELKIFRESLLRGTKKAIEVLNFIKKLDCCFPNAWIAYRVLLTIPVTVASAERSFSKLKLIKSYLRSTMSQERLNRLAMISIEKNVLETLDWKTLIDTFATQNARRSHLL